MRIVLFILIAVISVSAAAQEVAQFAGRIVFERRNLLSEEGPSRVEMYYGDDIVLIHRPGADDSSKEGRTRVRMPYLHARYIVFSRDSAYYVMEGTDTIYAEWRTQGKEVEKQSAGDTLLAVGGKRYHCTAESFELKRMEINPFDGSPMYITFYRKNYLSAELRHNMGFAYGPLVPLILYYQEETSIDSYPSLMEQRAVAVERGVIHPFLEDWPAYKDRTPVAPMRE